MKSDAATGSISRFVKTLYPTPIEAVIASSRTIGIGISTRVMKDTTAVISASDPGISSPVKLSRAASSVLFP